MSSSIVHGHNSKSRFGQFVVTQLYMQGKNQKWLAEQCNVTQAHISMVLSGKANPSNNLLYDISNTLCIDSGFLIKALFESETTEK